jgi:molybdopterin converting factor small subunit
VNVSVTFFGPLAQFTGQERVLFDLPEGATYGDLLHAVGQRFGHRLHERMWDREADGFKGGILVLGQGRDHDARDTALLQGEEIKVIPVFAGG